MEGGCSSTAMDASPVDMNHRDGNADATTLNDGIRRGHDELITAFHRRHHHQLHRDNDNTSQVPQSLDISSNAVDDDQSTVSALTFKSNALFVPRMYPTISDVQQHDNDDDDDDDDDDHTATTGLTMAVSPHLAAMPPITEDIVPQPPPSPPLSPTKSIASTSKQLFYLSDSQGLPEPLGQRPRIQQQLSKAHDDSHDIIKKAAKKLDASAYSLPCHNNNSKPGQPQQRHTMKHVTHGKAVMSLKAAFANMGSRLQQQEHRPRGFDNNTLPVSIPQETTESLPGAFGFTPCFDSSRNCPQENSVEEDDYDTSTEIGIEQAPQNFAASDDVESSRDTLPIAAEIVLSEEGEGGLRERVAKELIDGCSVAELVPNKQGFYLSVLLYSIVVVIVIVWIVVASIILSGNTDSLVGSSRSDEDTNSNNNLNPQTMTTPPAPINNGHLPEDDTILAQVPTTICHEHAPLMGSSSICPPQPLGSAVSNLVAASRLWSVPQADISILSAGQVQTDIVEGSFSVQMAKVLLPNHNSTLVTIPLEGYQIIIALERALQKIFDDWELQFMPPLYPTFTGSSYPYGAGIHFDVNMTQPFPQRLSSIQVQNKTTGLWEEMALQGTSYTVVTDSDLAGGMNGYHEFAEQSVHHNDTELKILEQFVEFCRQEKLLAINPGTESYSTQSYVHDPRLVYR